MYYGFLVISGSRQVAVRNYECREFFYCSSFQLTSSFLDFSSSRSLSSLAVNLYQSSLASGAPYPLPMDLDLVCNLLVQCSCSCLCTLACRYEEAAERRRRARSEEHTQGLRSSKTTFGCAYRLVSDPNSNDKFSSSSFLFSAGPATCSYNDDGLLRSLSGKCGALVASSCIIQTGQMGVETNSLHI